MVQEILVDGEENVDQCIPYSLISRAVLPLVARGLDTLNDVANIAPMIEETTWVVRRIRVLSVVACVTRKDTATPPRPIVPTPNRPSHQKVINDGKVELGRV